MKGIGSGQCRESKDGQRSGESQGGECEHAQRPGGLSLGGQRQASQGAKRAKSTRPRVLCCDDLHSWQDGGVKKLHID